MKLPLIFLIYCIVLSPVYAAPDYSSLSTEQLQAKCNEKDGKACTTLGIRFGSGNGIEKSLSQENECYRKACDLADGLGCTSLGFNFENGVGVEKSLAKANDLYRKACDL